MNFTGEHILSTKQFDKDTLLELFALCEKMETILEKGHSDLLKGKILATLFFEPSTRTRFSFETAMLRLGGQVVSNPDMMANSSIKKMETLSDTGKTVSQMVDVIAMRHPEPGTVAELASGSDVPVLNGGDGPSEHPTQGLLDVYTIWKERGSLDGLTIALIGDLKYSRVQHSECDLLKHFDCNFLLVSPEQLRLPDRYKENFDKLGRSYEESDDLAGTIAKGDVISVSRLQNERFENPEDCEKLRGSFVVNKAAMEGAKADAIIISPLPRLEELPPEVDDDPRARYFQQIKNGVVVRMALLCMVLGIKV